MNGRALGSTSLVDDADEDEPGALATSFIALPVATGRQAR
jgi:hypothetical protein